MITGYVSPVLFIAVIFYYNITVNKNYAPYGQLQTIVLKHLLCITGTCIASHSSPGGWLVMFLHCNVTKLKCLCG